MKGRKLRTIVWAGALPALVSLTAVAQTPVSPGFTYQGRFTDGGNIPAAGSAWDFQFTLHMMPTGMGNQVGSPADVADVVVGAAVVPGGPSLTTAGVLTTQPLDFGATAFNGEKRYLQIGVRPGASTGMYTPLTPRQELTAAPHSSYAMGPWKTDVVTDDVYLPVGDVGIGTTDPQRKIDVFSPQSGLRLTGVIPNTFGGILEFKNLIPPTPGPTTSPGAIRFVGNTDTVLGSIEFFGLTLLPPPQPPIPPRMALNAPILALDAGNLILAADDNVDVLGGSNVDIESSNANIRLRTDGATRVIVDPLGNVGIGTTTPENTLHVHKGSAGTVTANGNSPLVVENSTHCYVNVLGPDGSERGVLFGDPTGGTAAGGVIFDSANTTNGLQFRTNTNDTQMVITDTGNVGIGTTTPAAKLHVDGGERVDGAVEFRTTADVKRFAFQPSGSNSQADLSLYLENGTTRTVELNSGSNVTIPAVNQGGFLALSGANGSPRAYLGDTGPADGNYGFFRLNTSDGDTTVRLGAEGGSSSSEGAHLRLHHGTNATVEIVANDHPDMLDEGAKVTLRHPSGNAGIVLKASEGNDGGQIELLDSSGDPTIVLDAEQGGVGDPGEIQKAYSGVLHPITPVAYGTISANGAVLAATSNVSSTFNSGQSEYEITISGENYQLPDFTTVVTVAVPTLVRIATTGSVSGKLIVHLWTPVGISAQHPFQFITYKAN